MTDTSDCKLERMVSMDAQMVVIYLLLFYASKSHLSLLKDFKNNSLATSRELRISCWDC